MGLHRTEQQQQQQPVHAFSGEAVTVDEALKRVGGFRGWSIFIFVLLSLSTFTGICLLNISLAFIGWEPDHHCRLPPEATSQEVNLTRDTPHHVVLNASSCHIRVENHTLTSWGNVTVEVLNTSPSCEHGWEYESGGYNTIATEWNLVCGSNFLVEKSQVISESCSLVGSLVLPCAMDLIGRKPSLVISNVIMGLLGIGLAFVQDYTAFVILRTVQLQFLAVPVVAGVTLVLELSDSSRRTLTGVGLEFPFVAVFCLLPLLAYLIADWRHLQLVCSGICVLWILLLWVVPESPVWLYSRGRYSEAEQVLRQIARRNGVTVRSLQLMRPQTGSDEHSAAPVGRRRSAIWRDKLANFSSLVCDKTLAKHTLLNGLLWFVNVIIYYSLTWMSPRLPGNRFVNFLVMGLIELPAYVIVFFVIKRWGRRVPLCVMHVITALPLIVGSILQSKITGSLGSLPAAPIFLFALAKFGITSSFAIIVLYTPELFPTDLRGTSGGLGKVTGGIGTILAPLAAYAMKTQYDWLPAVVFGLLSILVGLAALVLPETNGKPLPVTLADVKALYKVVPARL